MPSEGEKARSMSAAMIPTGKKRRTSGGGGRGGSMSGSTTIDAASAARMRTDPKLKHRTMLLLLLLTMMLLLLFSLRSCSSPTPREGKSVVSDTVRSLNLLLCMCFSKTLTLGLAKQIELQRAVSRFWVCVYIYSRRGAWCIGLGLFLSLWREFRWMDPSGVGPTCWMCAVG